MYEDIKKYIQICNTYQKRVSLKTNNVLHSIKLKAPFYRIGINIVGLLTIIKKGNKYIMTAMDYFTKQLIVKTIKEVTAKIISKFIYEK